MNRSALHSSVSLAKLASPAFLLAIAFGCVPLVAQQPYSTYGAQGSQVQGGQYAAPGQPYAYAQPNYAQPQYQQPQYGQSQIQQPDYAQPQYPQQYSQPQYSDAQPYPQQPIAPDQYAQPTQQTAPPLSADQLEQLVAPIALYPDQLLAQILTAATYPAQVAAADQWLQQMQAQGAASQDQIAAGADAQTNWDPSVKALTAFPQVLSMLNQNLQWTTSLGNAYYNQPQDVMQTVQVLRQRAEDAGTLQSTPQEQMTYDQGAIELAPANPQVVYVPTYNPWYVYGAPIAPYPGFSLLGALGSFFIGGPIHYGLGIGIGAFENFPWGWLGWAFDWLGHSIFFHHNAYFTHSTTVADWGFPHGGARAYGGWARSAGYATMGSGAQNYARAGYGSGQYTARPTQSFGRTSEAVTRPTPQFARSSEGFAANQRGQALGESARESYNRGYSGQSYGAVRPAMPSQQAYNRAPQPISRPQAYASNPAYGYNNRPAQTFAERPGVNYGSPAQAYRAPQAFAQRQPRNFASVPERSGGFFGRSSEPKNFGGGSFGGSKAPKGFGGGGGSFKAPKESHSSGGGRKR